MIIARQHHGVMRIIATHEHQQPIFLRHIDDVWNGYHPVPILGHNLQLRGKLKRFFTAVQLTYDMRSPGHWSSERGGKILRHAQAAQGTE
jgi:hypothetical protein